MTAIILNLAAAFVAAALFIGHAECKIESLGAQSISQPDKNEYRAMQSNSDQHKFGYELAESKVFHHTTTDEDGVRLGCYGHILEGKKYSTQYVADTKGYRIVHTHDLITVYPKSGGERKASFIREFSENDLMSQNIRFFFPTGCQAKEELIAEPSIQVPIRVLAPTTTRTTTTRATTTRATAAPTTRATVVTRTPSTSDCSKPNCVCTCT